MRHIDWAEAADVVVIAPATANLVGKIAGGIADDALTRTIWNRIVESAERFNEPGVFSAIHGFAGIRGPAWAYAAPALRGLDPFAPSPLRRRELG